MYVCMYVCMYACMHVCMHPYMHACMYVCVCIYVHVDVCIYIYLFNVCLHHRGTTRKHMTKCLVVHMQRSCMRICAYMRIPKTYTNYVWIDCRRIQMVASLHRNRTASIRGIVVKTSTGANTSSLCHKHLLTWFVRKPPLVRVRPYASLLLNTCP